MLSLFWGIIESENRRNEQTDWDVEEIFVVVPVDWSMVVIAVVVGAAFRLKDDQRQPSPRPFVSFPSIYDKRL